MTLSWQRLTLQLRNPFGLSYGTSATRDAFWLRLPEDSGWGEGTIPPYYGVAVGEMEACWRRAASRTDPLPDHPAAISAWVGDDGPAPARSALDLALHDRLGRLQGRPLFELLDLPRPAGLATSFTISISAPEEMARQATAAASYFILKIKLGSDDDHARLAAVRAARPDASLFVDANAAWTAEQALRQLEGLLPYGIALVEQPVARADFAGMGAVQARLDLPVVADESVQSLADVERLAAAGVQGINLKLMKVGGLAPALEIARRARELGMRLMLGCMIETSLGVTAMAHLAGLADWLDLDAPLLIANDPFEGIAYDAAGRIRLPDRPGIGARLRNEAPG